MTFIKATIIERAIEERMDLKVTLKGAIEIATQAHRGQVDKQGVDYIKHPLRVMEAVEGDLEKIVAVLHDVLEDTEETESSLLEKGIPRKAIDKIKILTRNKTENKSYESYIDGICQDAIARKIKLEDLRDNLREGCPESLRGRYEKAMEKILTKHFLSDIKLEVGLNASDNSLDRIMRFFASDIGDLENPRTTPIVKEKYTLLGWDMNERFDVINSFWTLFRVILLKEYPYLLTEENGTEVTYLKKKELAELFLYNKCYRDALKNIVNKYPDLEQYAELTHCVANFMPCPDAPYNQCKGVLPNGKDSLVLMINQIQQWIGQYKNEKDENKVIYTNLTRDIKVRIRDARKWHEWFLVNHNEHHLEMYYNVTGEVSRRLIGNNELKENTIKTLINRENDQIGIYLKEVMAAIRARAGKLTRYVMEKSQIDVDNLINDRSCINRSVHSGGAERFDKAKEQYDFGTVNIERIIELTKEFIEEYGLRIYEGEYMIRLEGTNIKKFNKDIQKQYEGLTSSKDIVWMKFAKAKTMGPFLGVVGCSNDINFDIPPCDYVYDEPRRIVNGKIKSWKYNTSGILLHSVGLEWDESFILVFPLIGLKEGKEGKKQRHEIENGIGNYLISKGVPIIDYYSHRI